MTTHMLTPGPDNAITDVPGIFVGSAADAQLKSGVSVVTSDTPFTAGVHVMGGAPGTRETDLLAADKFVSQIDALVLSGGSAFGLDAASGVADALRAAGRGFQVGTQNVPIVPAAILFDLLNGGDKGWNHNPYHGLGRAAFEAAGAPVLCGTYGAGYGALAGDVKGGLGTASFRLPSGHHVGALVAVNSVGSPLIPDTNQFWAAPFEVGAEFGGLGLPDQFAADRLPVLKKLIDPDTPSHTTIAIIATDASLSKAEATRMAIAAHDGIGRALVPAHTPFDGDLVFSAATARHKAALSPLDILTLGHVGSLCLARAIARAVYAATPEEGDLFACWSQRI